MHTCISVCIAFVSSLVNAVFTVYCVSALWLLRSALLSMLCLSTSMANAVVSVVIAVVLSTSMDNAVVSVVIAVGFI